MDEIPLFMELHEHGGESLDLNDRKFRAGIHTKQVNKFITLFLIPNQFSKNKAHIPPNYLKQTFISKLLHNVQ